MGHAYAYFLSLLVARTIVIFLLVVAGLRLLGKRQIGQVNIYDLALIMALSNAVQNAMTAGLGDLSVGIAAAGTLLILGRIFSTLFLRIPKLEQNLCGVPSVLINDGKIVDSHMKRENVTEEQLLAALRAHGLASPEDARMAVLEIDGSLSIVPKQKL